MAKILLTGASGLIGSRLSKSLQRDGDVVYAISRSTGATDAGVKAIPIDLERPWSVAELPRGVETVVHLAQSEHFREFPERAEEVFAVNTQSTVKLLDYARATGVRQFVLASSGGVYGAGPDAFAEDAGLNTGGELGFYIGTRLCSEILSEAYTKYLNVISLRFFFVYGAGQKPHMLVPRLLESVRTSRPVILRGPEGLRLNPIYVDDAAMAVRHAMRLRRSYKINVAGPAVLSLRKMAEIIGEVVGKPPVLELQPADSRDLVANTSLMRSLLCEPRMAFREGLVATIAADGTA